MSDSAPLRSASLRVRLALLLLALAVLAAAAIWQTKLSYDLAYFLPAPQTPAQKVLVERLGQGPGARLIFVELPNAEADKVTALAAALRATGLFKSVWPDATQAPLQLPEPVARNRLLLGDLPQSRNEWRATLRAREADISSAPDDQVLALIAQDPALMAANALRGLQLPFASSALDDPQRPVLVLRSQATAFDLAAQQSIAAGLQTALREQGIDNANIYGTGQYGVALQSAVRQESVLFTSMAGVALTALVLWRFRSITALLCAALPLLVGALCGLLMLSLTGAAVHGITLAFGFTLLGVAIDYPLHLLTHHQAQPGANSTLLWRTLRLGVLSTTLAYAAFLLSGADGLLQLGVFACTGICTAALCTGFLMHGYGRAGAEPMAGPEPAMRLSHGPWLVVIAVTLPILWSQSLFDDDLGTMTPVPRATLAADSALRARLGTVNLRYLVAVRASDQEQTLQTTEALAPLLQQAVARGDLSGFQSIHTLLPSRERQASRRAALASSLASSEFHAAVAESAFQRAAFEPFVAAVKAERDRQDWLSAQSYQTDPDMADLLANHLYLHDNEWVSLVLLQGLTEPQTLAAQLAHLPNARLIDLKQASLSLVSDYRSRLLKVLAIALLLVGLLLWSRTGQLRRTLWLLGTLLSAVALATVGKLMLSGPLSLFDLMALALVAGLGLDYALFYSLEGARARVRQVSHRAVTLCAASSLLVFGILSLSSIPLLNGIGTSVTLGVLAAYTLAYFGRHQSPKA